MPGIKDARIEIRNHLEDTFLGEIRRDVFRGFIAEKKYIPSKYFYDSLGSLLFEEICSLPEYYPTRTEMSILRRVAPEIMRSFPCGDIVELGSGSNLKIRMLLDAAGASSLSALRYVPVDVSESALLEASGELLDLYPELTILGIIADFTRHVEVIPNDRPRLMFFFGSTIGNFTERACNEFLNSIAESMKPEDRFLVGLDMLKPRRTLEVAYNDSLGITSRFNKNVLTVINRELHANFNQSHFDHQAFFNEEMGRIEMHLRANREISVEIEALGLMVELDEGETIHTEICRKFSRDSAEKIAHASGLVVTRWFSDPKEWFALVEMRKKPVNS
jgi:L-histidine N-alpha-methyltransferase